MRIIELMKEKQGVLIGMVHCLPLPGAMNHCGSMDAVVAKAVADAKKLEQAGFDAVLVEPTLDRPMGMTRGPLQLAAMNASNIYPQLLTIEAARTGDRRLIYQAAMMDPVTSAQLSTDEIISLCDDLIEAHAAAGFPVL